MALGADFQQMVHELKLQNCNDMQLKQLKNQFKHLINSRRSLDAINNIEEIVNVLQRRDELNEERLKEIAAIIGYTMQVNQLNIATAVLSRDETTCPSAPRSNERRSAGKWADTDELNEVYDVICNDMGSKYWKKFARELRLKEGHIDDLDKIINSSEITRKILLEHERKCNPSNWRQDLLKALRKINRNDLNDKVETLLNRYNIVSLT